MPKANFMLVDGTSRTLEVPVGTSLMVAATHAGLKDIVAECGGAMSCASCHVMVEPAYRESCPPKSAAEDQMLDFTVAPREPGSRLSCQLIMAAQMDGITVRVADAQV